MSGNVIDLFTKQKVQQGGHPPTPEEFVDEAEFVDEFKFTYMAEFLSEVDQLDKATTIDHLEMQIRRIKELVAEWPRMPQR